MPNYTEKYKLHDRSNWMRGPWDREPYDKLVWVDQNTGLDCMMLRNEKGAWCGYAGVPSSHSMFGVEYATSQQMWEICVHGGITYTAECHGDVCHMAEEGDHVWWFGFDCCHSGDSEPSNWRDFHRGEYRTQNYVIEQVESLAKQLVNMVRDEDKEEPIDELTKAIVGLL